VGTYDGTTQRLYINGSQVGSQALAGAATVTTSGLWIGSWDGGSERFSGVIDDVAIYNQALSAAAVSSHYSAAQAAAVTSAQTTATTSGTPPATSVARVAATTTTVVRKARIGKHRAKRHAKHRARRHASRRSHRRR
jgi:hypothetical protein